MENQDVSIQAPLLENHHQQKNKKVYLKTNIFDTYLLFWVGKLINVIL